METSYENKVAILADLWLNYRQDEEFLDFIEYNDLGLPLAYAINESIIETTELASHFIEETFSLLLEGLEIPEDQAFEDLDEMLAVASDLDD
jgi:hypothetical protein